MNNENKNHKNLIQKLFRDKVKDILDRKTHKAAIEGISVCSKERVTWSRESDNALMLSSWVSLNSYLFHFETGNHYVVDLEFLGSSKILLLQPPKQLGL